MTTALLVAVIVLGSVIAAMALAGPPPGRYSWQHKVAPWFDPVGWDVLAQRRHDVTLQPDGHLLHHSICWCRRAQDGGQADG